MAYKGGLRQWIRDNRDELDRVIHTAQNRGREHNPVTFTLNDEDRRLWVLNDEGLYLWAKGDGVRI